MNANKFLKLYDVFNNMGIQLKKEQVTELCYLPDNVINYITKNGFYKHELNLILDSLKYYKHYINDKKLLDFYKIYIKSANHQYLLELLDCAYILNSDYFIEIVKAMSKTKFPWILKKIYSIDCLHIVNKAYVLTLLSKIDDEQKVSNAAKVAFDLSTVYQSTFDYCDLVEIVAKSNNSDFVAELALNKSVRNTYKIMDLAKILSKSKNPGVIYNACIDTQMLRSNYQVRLVELISSSENPKLLYSLIQVILPLSNVVEITEIIAKSKNLETIEKFLWMPQVYKLPEFLELIKILAVTKHSEEVFEPICYNEILESGKILEIAEIISSSKNFSAACKVAVMSHLYDNENYVEFVRITGNSKNRSNTVDFMKRVDAYPKDRQLEIANMIASSKYPIYSEYLIFSENFRNNVDEGIKLLNIIESSNVEKASFIYHLNLKHISITEILQLLEAIGDSINSNNLDATYQILTSGDYKRSKTPIDSVANIIASKNIYMRFDDAYELDPKNAIESLKEYNKEFPKSEFYADDTYVKTKKISKKKNLK